MTTKRLRMGVIGLGMQGTMHLHDLAANPRVELRAICDIDEQLLQTQAEAFGVPMRFIDCRQLIECDEIEAVAIVLPDHLHREPAVAALDAGKHVLLEKPMALTVGDAQAIASAAHRSQSCFMLNMSNRWMYPFAKGKQLIDSGELGEVRYIFTRLANRIEIPTERLPWLQNSHLALWIGIHRLDIARWYIGREVTRVRAIERKGVLRDRGFEYPDLFQATLEFDGGAVVNLECNWILPPSHPALVDSKFSALCSRGLIDWPAPQNLIQML